MQKSTLTFLHNLAKNNNRDWFMVNKSSYEAARQDVLNFTDSILSKLTKIDPAVSSDTSAKNCVMRIYRDIRFSKNKTPYKNNFGISIPAGKDGDGPGYYIHIQPGASFVGGGYWMPPAPQLKSIRQEIDYNANALTVIVDKPDFKNAFGDFRQQERLKTTPRDYDSSHEHIELIKLKSFAAIHPLSDNELLKTSAQDDILVYFSQLYPLNTFLNNAIS